MATRTVDFYFDYVSPYAYLAWPSICGLCRQYEYQLRATPVLFAGLLNAHGNLGPAEVPAKRLYAFRHAQRVARDLGLPLRCPPAHPFNPLLALRVTCVVDDPSLRSQVISTLFDAVWGRGKPIDTPAAVRAAFDSLGFDLEAFIKAAGDPEAKARLRRQTDEAVAHGVFVHHHGHTDTATSANTGHTKFTVMDFKNMVESENNSGSANPCRMT